jgi:hypothetical protein
MSTEGLTMRGWISRVPELTARGRGPVPTERVRPSLLVHLGSLVAIGAVYVYLGRSQWFFYDEWSLLVTKNQWDLLAPHNGHLSLGLALVFTLIKLVVGLHSYWPYLAVTLVLHLALVHLLWRLMNRLGVHAAVALLLSCVFGVLGPGAQNTLWAFQTGFIAPLVLGLVAVLLIDRPVFTRRHLVAVTVLLLVGVSFSSTALPMTAAVLLLLLVRRGWKPAVLVGVIFGVPYLVWRVVFVSGPQPTAAFAAHGLGDFAVAVPNYLTTSLVDSVADSVPFGLLAPVLLTLFLLWLFLDLRRSSIRNLGTAHFLVFGAFVFAALVAVSRVNLGIADAASGRYVYVYAALLLPAIGLALTGLIRATASGVIVVALLLVVVGLFNVVELDGAASSQAQLEQFTKQSIFAVLAHAKTANYSPNLRPLPVLAPDLTLAEIQDFSRRGELSSGSYTASALLSTRVNMDLRLTSLGSSASPAYCQPEVNGSYTLRAGATHTVSVTGNEPVTASLVVTAGKVSSQYNQITLPKGVHKIVGFEQDTITITPQVSTATVCVPDVRNR